MALAFVASVVMFFALRRPARRGARQRARRCFTWLPAGTLQVDIGFLADPLSVTWILLVTGVGSLIHLYSIGYMHGDPRFCRFFAYLNLFAASMLDARARLAASSSRSSAGRASGLCSYLLISFWFERNSAAVAGKKAFVTNRVGDVGFLLAMFLIFATYGTLDYTAIERGRAASSRRRPRPRSRCCCSSARSARARRSRCTSGCPTRWKARRRSRRSSTPPRWSPPACSSSCRAHAFLERRARRVHGRGVGRRDHRAARGDGRDHAARHQARARVLHDQPARLHVPRRRRRRVHAPRLHGDLHAFFKGCCSSAPAR